MVSGWRVWREWYEVWDEEYDVLRFNVSKKWIVGGWGEGEWVREGDEDGVGLNWFNLDWKEGWE